MFAEDHTGSARRRRLEGAAILFWSIGLHVPCVEVRRAAAEPDENGRFRDLAAGRRRCGRRDVGEIGAEEAQSAGDEKGAPVDGLMNAQGESHGWSSFIYFLKRRSRAERQ